VDRNGTARRNATQGPINFAVFWGPFLAAVSGTPICRALQRDNLPPRLAVRVVTKVWTSYSGCIEENLKKPIARPVERVGQALCTKPCDWLSGTQGSQKRKAGKASEARFYTLLELGAGFTCKPRKTAQPTEELNCANGWKELSSVDPCRTMIRRKPPPNGQARPASLTRSNAPN
jgi:hypothetical protein